MKPQILPPRNNLNLTLFTCYVIRSDMLCNHFQTMSEVKGRHPATVQYYIYSKSSAKGPPIVISSSQRDPMRHTTSRTKISQPWPEGLFQCSEAFGSRPRVMMSAHCIEVTNSIIHKLASFWINILTHRLGVYSTAPVKAV